jgi:hypothetical protein
MYIFFISMASLFWTKYVFFMTFKRFQPIILQIFLKPFILWYCVAWMLKDLELPLLQERRKQLWLTFMFKVVEGLMPAIPSSAYFEPVPNKRRIRATHFSDFESTLLLNCQFTLECNIFIIYVVVQFIIFSTLSWF